MSGQTQFDALVIGAGHNGLAAAATLARKGKSVCVIERTDTPGGMCRQTELDGASVPQIAHLLYNFNPVVAKELGVSTLLQCDPLPTLSLDPDGRHVEINDGQVRHADGSPHPKAAAYATLQHRLERYAGLLAKLSTRPPPSLEGGLASLSTLTEVAGLARLGLDIKRLGKSEMREFLRVLLSNIYDVALDELEDGPLAGAMAADAVRGNFLGPRSPGTVFNYMYRLGNGGTPRLPKGGMGSVVQTLVGAARSGGGDLRCGVGVSRILVEKDQVQGVELEDGTILTAPVILSSAGPMQTMQMAGLSHFDTEMTRRARNIRSKGTVAKLNLLLSGPPEFIGLSDEQTVGRLLIAPSAEYVERAFNPVKYGALPSAPTIELIVPSLRDASLTGDGRHVLSALISFVRHTPEGGWTPSNRATLQKTIMQTLAPYAPNLAGLVSHAELLTPADVEAQTGAPGGHWHHADMGVDQVLTVRPMEGASRYHLAVEGLYLCGAAAHPGGDITGAPGRNAALQALKDGGGRG